MKAATDMEKVLAVAKDYFDKDVEVRTTSSGDEYIIHPFLDHRDFSLCVPRIDDRPYKFSEVLENPEQSQRLKGDKWKRLCELPAAELIASAQYDYPFRILRDGLIIILYQLLPPFRVLPNPGLETAVKIIDHKSTLVLYIHEREQASRGILSPIWTMFHAKDGYITLAREKDGKTSWRTASFDNLEHSWRFVNSCSFYSPEDQARLEHYFHDSKSRGFAPLIQAQNAMKAQRLEQHLEKRRQKIRDRMACLPALPSGWQSWAYRAALPTYFFYDYKKGQKSAKGICSGCGRELIMKSRKRRGWMNDRDTCQIIQRTAPDEIVIRIIKVDCCYNGDTPVRDAHENARLFIRFDDNRPVHWEEYHEGCMTQIKARMLRAHWAGFPRVTISNSMVVLSLYAL